VTVDSVEGSFVNDEGGITHTFESVFLGPERGPDDKSPPEFACPGMEKDMDDWKCRPLKAKTSNG
jgi:hypothetical protein